MLTDARLRALKPRARLYRVADRDGLCIEVRPTGARLWRFRYRFAGKAQMVGLGEYPVVGLQEARKRVLTERERLAHGTDPAAVRRQLRHAKAIAGDDSLKSVAAEWIAKRTDGGWSQATIDKHTQRLETWAFPYLGKRAMRSITAADLLLVVQRPENASKIETAHRLKQVFGSLFRYAISTGRADADPSTALRGALVPLKVTHRASLKNPQAIGAMLRAIDGYSGRGTAATAALKLAPLVFVRPGELRKAEWREFEFKESQWRIPAERMKMGEQHLVPLSRQALAILRELQPVTGAGRYVFPSIRTRTRPLSENTINAALRRLGYTKEEMTAHGFRSIASTMLNEAGFNSDWIEAQLAHADPTVRGDYNFALYLPQRRKMMQAWADMLDKLRDDRKVVKLRA